jgi:MFS family permease
MKTDTGPWYRGLTRYQWVVLTVAWLGWVFDIADSAIFALAKISMLTEILGKEEYTRIGKGIEAQIQMLFLIGWSIGGLVFGILADKWGRTRVLVLTVLMYSALTALTALCHTVQQVEILRFLTALGIGGEWAAGAALIAEVFPDKARAPAASILQTAAAIGPVLAALGNQALSTESWRWLFVLGAVPALITVVIRFYVPEPARSVRAEKRKDAGSLKAIFSNPVWRRYAIVAMVVGIIGIAGSNNLSFWMPNLVKAASEGLSDALIKTRTSYVTYTMHVGTLLGVFFFPWLCQRIGRRTSFAIFFAASPLALALITYGAVTYQHLLLLAPVTTFFVIGLTSGYALYFPELFPAHLRATGAGLAYNTGRIATAPVPIWTASLMKMMNGSVSAGVLVAGAAYVIGLIALPFAPETKGKGLPSDEPEPGAETSTSEPRHIG